MIDDKIMKQTDKYYCEECGKYLFNTDKPRGGAGSLALRLGFVYKMPIIFGIEGSHFFCCKECWNRWLAKRTTPETREEGAKVVAGMKQRFLEMKPSLEQRLQRMQKAFEKMQKK